MTTNPFRKASKEQAKLRLAFVGPAGSGKTYSALSVATALMPGAQIAVIDTERGSASKYAGLFNFDVLELTDFHPQRYIDALRDAVTNGYEVVIVDSLSHAWMGKGGALEMVDNAAKRSQSGNSFAAWRDVTPLHNQLVDALLATNAHLIVTMRSKMEYVLEKDEKTGKTAPRKVGMAPIQRDGLEYEFDIVGDLDIDNTYLVSKSRCPALKGAIIPQPGAQLAAALNEWLTDGEPVHWVKYGGERFKARMNALKLDGEYVLAHLEAGRTLARLSDTTLNEQEALAKLEALAGE